MVLMKHGRLRVVTVAKVDEWLGVLHNRRFGLLNRLRRSGSMRQAYFTHTERLDNTVVVRFTVVEHTVMVRLRLRFKSDWFAGRRVRNRVVEWSGMFGGMVGSNRMVWLWWRASGTWEVFSFKKLIVRLVVQWIRILISIVVTIIPGLRVGWRSVTIWGCWRCCRVVRSQGFQCFRVCWSYRIRGWR